MPDPVVTRWKQRGRLSLWKYRSSSPNYSGWNLSADSDGAEALLELFGLMKEATFSSRKRLAVTSPERAGLAYGAGEPKCRGPAFFEVRYRKGQVEGVHFEIFEESSVVVLEVGEESLAELTQGIVDLAQKQDDYSIGSDAAYEAGNELWFWQWYAA